MLGAISEFDKAMTVAKLRGARERKRRGKCEGRKTHAELNPSWSPWSVNSAGVAPRAGKSRCGRFQQNLRSVGY